MMRWMTISQRHIKYSCWYAVYLYLNLGCLIFHTVLTDSSTVLPAAAVLLFRVPL